ncbi:MAG TPA: radical SAM family heme chaperone HemW [Desulfobacteraceae bacterium]|nr:radical SAM family heme chaperone HemW [Desulfobacteraceae bacterium]
MSDHCGLYIHVPFCVRKCPYCDFFSIADLSLKGAFVKALLGELALRSDPDLAIDTIYFGGGTSSLLRPGEVEQILQQIDDCFCPMDHCEITMEVNPGTVAGDFFPAVRSLGVNRLNIGVQSFDDGKLAFLGRVHSAAEAERAIVTAEQAGFDNLGIDVMYGVPEEDEQCLVADLDAGLRFPLTHLSCYMLTYEPGTALQTRVDHGEIFPLGETPAAALFTATSRHLERKGFLHYEISNFARGRDRRSRHNSKYWTMAPYLGFGPSAHSFDRGWRWWNHSDVTRYMADLEKGKLPVMETETLSQAQKMAELVMLGLRTSRGVDVESFEAVSGHNFFHRFAPLLKDLVHRGLGSIRDDGFALTLKGMLYLDSIVARFAGKIL